MLPLQRCDGVTLKNSGGRRIRATQMWVEYNRKGYRIGETHHRAKLTNHEVALIFELREQGLTIARIAEKMECGSTTVWKILQGQLRGQSTYRREKSRMGILHEHKGIKNDEK